MNRTEQRYFISLLNYLPTNAFYAEISKNADLSKLQNYKAIAAVKLQSNYKLTKKLINKKYEDWALDGAKIKLNAIFFEGITSTYVSSKLNDLGAKVLFLSDNNTIRFEINIDKLQELYSQSHFYFFEQIDAPGEPENLVGVSDHRSNNLATSYTSGLQYDGTGITVMLQDNSMLDNHIDYTGRYTDMNSVQSGDHGEHCGGTIAGAGNLNPIYRGMAYGADVLVYDWDNNNYQNFVANLYTSNDLTITSKSYSNGVNAGYTSLAQLLDQQVRLMPELIHVFSAGNSNGSGSTPAGSQWFNITGGHKVGKNTMTCANLTENDVISGSSSRGPAEDGRIKPDISAVGTSVWSTNDPNNYVQ
ncbi:MAG: S8 family serine peptidase, partial [Sneathiella sp.]|nr:S8 family serine peptidase [Sneathiella sp.]